MGEKEYDHILKSAPVASIDLIIKNKAGEYLLNLRGTRPAKDKWFFFGGSIKKPEELKDAFNRIIDREFKGVLKLNYNNAVFIKQTVHKYKENRHENVGSYKDGIHYVVLCYEIITELSDDEIIYIKKEYAKEVDQKKSEAHVKDIKWFREDEMQESEVHEYVKRYFNLKPIDCMNDLISLYGIYSKSINSYTTVIWAFPVIYIGMLGTLYYYYNKDDVMMIVAILFGYVLIQAFWKHTLIHEHIKNSLDNIERKLKSRYIKYIPKFTYPKQFQCPSHKIVRFSLFLINSLLLFKCIVSIIWPK
jgi:colanic acid biosynthesis protein WcaH